MATAELTFYRNGRIFIDTKGEAALIDGPDGNGGLKIEFASIQPENIADMSVLITKKFKDAGYTTAMELEYVNGRRPDLMVSALINKVHVNDGTLTTTHTLGADYTPNDAGNRYIVRLWHDNLDT